MKSTTKFFLDKIELKRLIYSCLLTGMNKRKYWIKALVAISVVKLRCNYGLPYRVVVWHHGSITTP